MKPATPVTPEVLRSIALPQPEEGSKEERGRVVVVGGSLHVPGAVLLAGTAALRAGAGKLQIATVASLATALGLAVPEALVVAVPETDGGELDQDARPILNRATACNAMLVGPGMANGDTSDRLVSDLLDGLSEQTVVLDAGALANLVGKRDLIRSRKGRVVITPHAGEMAHLLDRRREDVEADPRAAAEEVAETLGVIVVMKGGSTHIVEPGRTAWLYEGGNVGLATSGSGDVLAGIIAGLAARGTSPAHAAIWGVYLHGEAGSRLARRQGQLGFLAREIAAEVPAIMAEFSAAPGG